MQPQLPRKIKVGEKWYSVEVVEAMAERGRMAYVSYQQKKITVARTSNVNGRQYKPHEVDTSFWHELVHAILDDMRHPLRRNEIFVDRFSSRLAKAIRSARMS